MFCVAPEMRKALPAVGMQLAVTPSFWDWGGAYAVRQHCNKSAICTFIDIGIFERLVVTEALVVASVWARLWCRMLRDPCRVCLMISKYLSW